MSFNMTSLLIAVVCFFLLVLPLCLFVLRQTRQWATPAEGDFVAEVWLQWPICRGSTLYRGRFKYRWMARIAVKLHAMALDGILPTHFRTTDWSGRPYWESHDYGIEFGVRSLTAAERITGVPGIWSPTMPGTEDYRGEHRVAHPVWGDEAHARAEQAYGVKL